MKRWIVLLAVAAVMAPVAASAGTSPSATRAEADCTKLRAQVGLTGFAKAYATFGACVSAYAPVESSVTVSAQATCNAQQADPNFAASHNDKTFDQFYGTGKTESNAFGNCVSAVAKTNSKVEQAGRLNPARTCRAERTQLGTSLFDKTYGKNANDKNAFGKCVSKTAHAQAQNEVSASSNCQSQQSDPNFATAHNGQTFDQTYGTNADLSNAFGKCVSSTAKTTSTAQEQATVDAAHTCRSEQKSDPAAFKSQYGTFGRCVSQTAKVSQP